MQLEKELFQLLRQSGQNKVVKEARNTVISKLKALKKEGTLGATKAAGITLKREIAFN